MGKDCCDDEQALVALPTLKDFVSGGIGGAFCTYAGQPFDTVKVRLQTGTGSFQSLGPWGTVVQTAKNEGVTALWKGAVPSLYMNCIENVVLFSANGFWTKVLAPGKERSEVPIWKQYIIGGLSGLVSSVACNPAECLKCRMQVNMEAGEKASFMWATKTLWREEGVVGFFRGQIAQLSRDFPFYMLFFGFYEQYQSVARRMGWSESANEVSALNAIMGGGIAGTGAWSIVFPCDAVNSTQKAAVTPISFLRTIRQMYAAQGLRAFYQGYVPCVVRGFPANAALFWGVEMTRKLWTQHLE